MNITMPEDQKDQDTTINMMVSKIEASIEAHIHRMDVRRHTIKIILEVVNISEMIAAYDNEDDDHHDEGGNYGVLHDNLLAKTKELITLMRDPLGEEAIKMFSTDRTLFADWNDDFDSAWFINNIIVD
jgi:hypothetical protein